MVTKDVPPYVIFGGIPAKFIGKRFKNINDVKMHESQLFKERMLQLSDLEYYNQ